MKSEEIDNALEELETRLERLRSLYEQYFLGIEKIEPTVARKDVDRRFWLLRRMQIRNTARRFKMQVLVQRYNTFQQYWTRICREIENGTYARHVLKAQRNVGLEPKTWAAKKRLGLLRKGGEALAASPEPRTEVITRETETEIATLVDEMPSARGAPETLDDFDERETLRPRKAPPVRAPLPPLDLELDLGGDAPPRPAARVRPPLPGRRPAPVAAKAAEGSPQRAPLPLPDGVRPPSTIPPAAPKASPARNPNPLPGARRMPMPGPPRASKERPGPPPPPSAAKTPQAIPPALHAAPPAAIRRPNAEAAPVSDQRLRELHSQLIDARKQLNQRSNVSVDGLARTLRATADKLRERAQGRRLDFEVIVRDGQALVRPVLRK